MDPLAPPFGTPADEPTVRLLPMYDSYLLGHQSRDLLVPATYSDRVYPVGGVIRATVIAGGAVVGTWRLDRHPSHAMVLIEPFEPLDADVQSAIAECTEPLGAFLETQSWIRSTRTYQGWP